MAIKVMIIYDGGLDREASEHMLSLLGYLDREAYQVLFVELNYKKLISSVRAMGWEAHSLRAWPALGPGIYLRLRLMASHFGPDLLNVHGVKASLYGRFLGKFYGVPVVVTSLAYEQVRSWSKRLISAADRATLSWVKHFVVPTRAAARKLEEQGVESGGISVILQGLDLQAYGSGENRLQVRRHLGISPESVVVGVITPLNPGCGLRFFLEAASQVLDFAPETTFVIVGGGETAPELRQYARSLNAGQRIIFTGHRDDVTQLLDAFDIFVSPCQGESSCQPLLEAMASGKPVIATSVGGLTEVLTQRKAAALVPPGDSVALAVALGQLLDNPDLRLALGERARNLVEERFTIKQMVSRTQEVFQDVARNRKEDDR
ncbi:MAG: glycosyltransferase family 4 protein [Bacillota bacterium]